MSEYGDISYDGAPDVMQSLGHPAETSAEIPGDIPAGMPQSDPGVEAPGACPECGAPMEGNVCAQCGYSHETPVPPENLAEPSMSAAVGIALGKVIQHIATQAIATPVTDPEALKGLGAAAKDFADALSTVSPPPATPDPTKLEQLAQQDTDAERQQAEAEAQRQHDATEAEAEHERQMEQAEQQANHQAEQTEQQAQVQQAAQPQTGGGNGD